VKERLKLLETSTLTLSGSTQRLVSALEKNRPDASRLMQVEKRLESLETTLGQLGQSLTSLDMTLGKLVEAQRLAMQEQSTQVQAMQQTIEAMRQQKAQDDLV
jgi:DNA repair ATPase RecN